MVGALGAQCHCQQRPGDAGVDLPDHLRRVVEKHRLAAFEDTIKEP
jgi:hypothetical protein